MTTATMRGFLGCERRLEGLTSLLLFCALLLAVRADAMTLDPRGEMRLGLRSYTAVRIGTEAMGDAQENPLSFPNSGTGHLRQHRYFLEIKLDHDIKRLATTGVGIGWLASWLSPDVLKYSLQYRGEREGVFDYGPNEFSHQLDTTLRTTTDNPVLPGVITNKIPYGLAQERVDRVNRIARVRNRLFTAYMDIEKGPVFLRFGRQILAWGETDIFRLLDNINPLDNGFGGFLIALDERRVPVNMVRGNYHFTSIGPLNDAFLEGFVAEATPIATQPGIPPGSPWIPGGLGYPNPAVRSVIEKPPGENIRGGGRFVFTAMDATFTLAHYWTYLDTPGVVFTIPSVVPSYGHEILATQKMPRIPITGASVTFPVTSLYSVVRSELAYFTGEPMNRQGRGIQKSNLEGSLNPFAYPGFLEHVSLDPNNPDPQAKTIHGTILQLDSLNYAIGLDVNRFIRWLNPTQTFFISTQAFYKHIFNSPGDTILPVPVYNQAIPTNQPGTVPAFLRSLCLQQKGRLCNLAPRFIHNPENQVLHTLLITTSYQGGRIVPSFGMFYDWQGAVLVQPGVQLVKDPFRFVFDYTFIHAGIGSGQIAALRDRDNARFQVEYVF